jgi:hypothetical protein
VETRDEVVAVDVTADVVDDFALELDERSYEGGV